MKKIILLIFISANSLSIFGQNFCINSTLSNDTIITMVSDRIRIVGEDIWLNKIMAAHLCKCKKELKSFRKLLIESDSIVASVDSFLYLNPTYRTGSNAVAEGNLNGVGKVSINYNYLGQLPDPITRSNDMLSISEQKFKYKLVDIYDLEGIETWATTICGFLAHEIKELTLDIRAGKRNRPVHHCVHANKMEDIIMKETTGSYRKRGREGIVNHKSHIDYVIEIVNKGYIIIHTDKVRARVGSNGFVDHYQYWTPHHPTHVEYLNQEEFKKRDYTMKGCVCIDKNKN